MTSNLAEHSTEIINLAELSTWWLLTSPLDGFSPSWILYQMTFNQAELSNWISWTLYLKTLNLAELELRLLT